MNRYIISAELLSPLSVLENRQSNTGKSLDYLPGSTLRGAIAGHYIRTGKKPESEEFRTLFIENPVRFPDLLPSVSADVVSCSFPMTVASCKRNPGFLADDAHGVHDMLANIYVSEKAKERVSASACSECDQPLKPFQGYWNGHLKSPQKIEPSQMYERHTGIDRSTGTIATGIFFTTRGVEPYYYDPSGQHGRLYLTGEVWLDKEQHGLLTGILDALNESCFVGSDKTKGLGEIKITLSESGISAANSGHSAMSIGVEEWDRQFKDKIKKSALASLPDGIFFSIGLSSHGILLDELLRPVFRLPVDYPDVELLTYFCRKHVVRGWQSSWGLPKSEDIAIARNSVYLYIYKGNDVKGLEDHLNRLAIQGIGLRCEEGFGQIKICDTIHIREVL